MLDLKKELGLWWSSLIIIVTIEVYTWLFTKCSLLCKAKVGERQMIGLDPMHMSVDAMRIIREHLKAIQHRQKNYADKQHQPLEIVRDHVFL